MSIRGIVPLTARACQTKLACRLYSQDSRISFGKVAIRGLAPKICPWLAMPGPFKSNAPRYFVLTKAECEAHDEKLWVQELKKASEEFKKAKKKD